MRFEDLRLLLPEVRDNVRAMGFNRPTDIQFKVIPHVLEGDDILAIAQTGTGKTAAFAIPVVSNLMRRPRRWGYEGVRCVVMEPTHELAAQVAGVIKDVAKGTGVSVVAVYGGVEQDNQIALLKGKADIVVATPGRLFDLAAQGHLVTSQAEVLVVDEADHMLALGFYEDIRQLVRRLPRRRQTLFFSATIDEKIKDLAYSLVYRAVRIEMSQNKVAKNVTHQVLPVPMDQKRFFLERIARENPEGHIMVFVRTKVRAERVKAAMDRVGLTSVFLHGGMSQRERQTALDDFRASRVQMLISTDVAARGIDIPGVDYVVNYDVPEEPENYVHRVGRTGRGMAKGYALTFSDEGERPLIDAIQAYMQENIPVLQMDRQDREATVDFSDDAANDWRSLIADD
ncbi:MAG: DEAD/DEAH box helicase [Bacteroidales bacterium]|nr:DEAD/DEAH box helicase [Bacteroidales bacterium]MDD7724067.1 DEAD/DEAH box helicase [Bacteroidales bacterium]MDY4174080.1 DEAD/DEAH box helicase [Bacteroidales bacterium]